MPEIVAHHVFARRVLNQLPPGIQEEILESVYRIGARGPDPLGVLRFWCPPVWKKEHGKSNQMHTASSGAFFQTLANEAKNAAGTVQKELFSYACGFLTHHYLDACCHPYIICVTGLGKGTSGNHRSLEHAMDRDLLKEQGLDLADRPISKMILPDALLPKTMQVALDRVYQAVFGWKDAWRTLNTALRDERRFVRLIEDRCGWLNRLASTSIRNGTVSSLSYREEAYQHADLWNEGHARWHNPYDPSLVSTESLRELMEKACGQAVEAIPLLSRYIFEQGSYPDTIENRSYESGLDANDPRNLHQLVFQLLPRNS